MAAITLNILKPSVNNLTVADLRARRRARLRRGRRLGQDRRARVPGEGPGPPDADDRGGGAAARDAVGELRDHAVPLQQARPRPVLSDRPGERAMVDSAMFYLIGTLYPLVARATYAALSFPQYPGEVGTSDADDAPRRTRSRRARRGRGAARRLSRVLPRRQARSSAATTPVDRRHPARRDARVPARDRLRLPGLGARSTSPRSRNRSARPTRSPSRTCAGTSST